MVKIGNIELSSPVILAPMAGISAYPYRMINRKMGVELAYLEMISARALSYFIPGQVPLKKVNTVKSFFEK